MSKLHQTSRNYELWKWLILGLLLSLGAIVATNALRWRSFNAEQDRIYRAVDSWRRNPPQNADRKSWEDACQMLLTACGNACFSPYHVSIQNMVALRRDMEAVNKRDVDFHLLDAMWDRLGRTGPSGRKYIDQMRPLWDEARKEQHSARVSGGDS
jgi:hypothetical protein